MESWNDEQDGEGNGRTTPDRSVSEPDMRPGVERPSLEPRADEREKARRMSSEKECRTVQRRKDGTGSWYCGIVVLWYY